MPLAAIALLAGLALATAGYSPRQPKPRVTRPAFLRPLTQGEALLLLTPAASLALH